MNVFINILIGLSLFIGLALISINPIGGILTGVGFALVLYYSKVNIKIKNEDPENYASKANKKQPLTGIIMVILGFIILQPDRTPEQEAQIAADVEKRRIIQEQAEVEKANAKHKGKWYYLDVKMGLGEMTGKNWLSYNDNQRLAISAEVLATYWSNKTLHPKIMNSIQSMDHLKPYAEELTNALNEFYSSELGRGNKSEHIKSSTIAESSVILIALMGWNDNQI